MEIILQRISPLIVSWLVVAFTGLGISFLTHQLLNKNYQIQKKYNVQEVLDMLKHNMGAEILRGIAQLIAIIIIIGYIFNIFESQIIGWTLVLMNTFIVGGSLNEFYTAIKIMRDD